MANNEDMEFWDKTKGKNTDEEEQKRAIAIDDEEVASMKIKQPKPFYEKPTKCKILDARFFKMEDAEKDTQGKDYIPYQVTVTYQQVNDTGIEFKETYRGGRVYTDEKTNLPNYYIGGKSALGRLKAVCISNAIEPGPSLKSWAEVLKGKVAILKGEVVMFGGEKYPKNFIQSFDPQ